MTRTQSNIGDWLILLAVAAFTALCAAGAFAAWRIAKAVDSFQASAAMLSSSGQKTLGVIDNTVPQIQASVQSGITSINTASTAVSGVAHQVGDQVPAISKKVGLNIDGATAILAHVNRNCGVKEDGKLLPCGTLADFAQTLGAYRRTATLINIAAQHEDRQLGKVDDSIAHFDDLLAALKISVSGLQPLEKQLTVMIAAAQPGVASMDHMLATADEVETKGTKDYLHPSKNPIKRTFNVVRPFLGPAAEVAGAIAR